MSRLFYHTMQDSNGNLLFDVSGTMRLAGTSTLATLYGDEALTVILPNPMTNHPNFASFKCYLGAPGPYDFYMAKAGYTFETLTGVQGLGNMAQQNANTVTITGGSATLHLLTMEGQSQFNAPVGMQTPVNALYGLSVGTQALFNAPVGIQEPPSASYSLNTSGAISSRGGLQVPDRAGNDLSALYSLVNAAGGTNRYGVFAAGSAQNYFAGDTHINAHLAVGGITSSDSFSYLRYPRATHYGFKIQPSDDDTGAGSAVLLCNQAGTPVGSINTTASATAFNTTSDARLKTAIAPLAGALDVVRALRPVAFRWKSDDSPGHGFLASEVQQVVDGVISGEADAVEEDGRIRPQMIDMSKLVPFLVGCCQELAAQVEALTARLDGAGAFDVLP